MAKKDTKSSNRKLHKDFEDMDDLDSLMLQIQLESPNRHRARKPDKTHKIVCIILITYFLVWLLVTP